MTTPPMPPRPSVGRSSFAIAMKDYTFIRPGIAVTISAGVLAIALFLGVDLISSLKRSAITEAQAAHASQTLHTYNAGLEVWHQMATSNDPAYKGAAAVAQRDSMREALRTQLAALGHALADSADQGLVATVLGGLASTDADATTAARQAMIVLLAHQDAAMFQAAELSQRGVLLAAVLLGLTIVAAGTLVIPMAWLYIRYKRGATIEVKI